MEFKGILWVVLLVLFFEVGECNDVDIVGDGAAFAKFLFQKLVFAYQQVNIGFNVNYIGGSQFTGYNAIKNNLIDFGLALGNLLEAGDGLMSFPLFSEACGFFSHVPGLRSPLNLTTSALAGIFSGDIRYWNDTLLTSTNPELSSLDPGPQEIVLVLREGTSATMSTFNSFMSSVSPQFQQYKGSAQYDPQLAAKTNYVHAKGETFELFSTIYKIPYSLSFGPFPSFNAYNILPTVNSVNIIHNNKTYKPSSETIQLTLMGASYNSSTKDVEFVSSHSSDGWPICSVYFIYLNIANNHNCSKKSELLKFFRFSILSPTAHSLLQSDGYFLVRNSLSLAALELMNNVTCNSQKSLKATSINYVTYELLVSFLTISTVICSLIVLTAVLLITKYETTIVGTVYNGIIIMAAITSYVSLVLHSIYPSNDQICQSRTWFMFLAVSMFLGAVFCRNIQMKAIKDLVDRGLFGKKVNNVGILIIGMIIIVLIQLIILIIWQVLDPLTSTLVLVDEWAMTYVAICTSYNIKMWLIIQFTFYIILLLFGIYVVYSTWNIRTQVDDARMIAVSVYLGIIIQGGSFLLDTSRPNLDYFYWSYAYLIFIQLSFCLSIFLPKIIRLNKKASSSQKGSHYESASSEPTVTQQKK